MKAGTLYFMALLVLSVIVVSGCATWQVTKSLDDRADEIAAKIAEAERLGARGCAPRELARAKVELERARHEMIEPHYPRYWRHAGLNRAEEVANELLEKRRLASNLKARFQCGHGGG